MVKTKKKFVVITGTPCKGFKIHGLFRSELEARKWIGTSTYYEWWIDTIERHD